MRAKHHTYFVLLGLLINACNSNEPTPVTEAAKEVDLTAPEAIEKFLESMENQDWVLSRMRFDDAAFVPALCAYSPFPDRCDSVKFIDLYEQLPDCRKDDSYEWKFEYSNGNIISYNNMDECDGDKLSEYPRLLSIQLDDERDAGEVTFKDVAGVNRFFGFYLEPFGSGYTSYQMQWQFTYLSKDSINIRVEFPNKQAFPEMNLQFIPQKL